MNFENSLSKTRHIVMAVLFIAMGVAMLFTEKLGLDAYLKEFDPTLRYFFGGICFLYGGFRVFRIIANR